MPTESDLRDRMREPRPGGTGGLDVALVVRAARRRRRPKVVLAGASAFVVAAAIVVPVAALGLRPTASSSAGSAVDTAEKPSREQSGGSAGPNAVGQDPCPTAPTATSAAVSGALELADSTAGDEVSGTLILTATAASTVTPSGTAVIVLLRDGVVVGQAGATIPSDPIAVGPGSDVRIPLTFRPVRCGSDTVLPVGEYSATVIVSTTDDSVSSGPPAPLRIR